MNTAQPILQDDARERSRCEQAWQQAARQGDREALRALRLQIIDATARAQRTPGARSQWQAWLVLRCALLLRQRSF
ncbi:hypothetical protein [Delftia sp. PS-11]|uniref:hypothetical protein n=1 Tax=Delftia sp. PS-11 TaxID=2767222 RepID=UPI0024577408|nr:hypothetical protein [Delftia sp. PS-11]KAJ8746664.1 hypothetical protein H9T68_00645 [Delftia sp. PS-11]